MPELNVNVLVEVQKRLASDARRLAFDQRQPLTIHDPDHPPEYLPEAEKRLVRLRRITADFVGHVIICTEQVMYDQNGRWMNYRTGQPGLRLHRIFRRGKLDTPKQYVIDRLRLSPQLQKHLLEEIPPQITAKQLARGIENILDRGDPEWETITDV